jgi:hypothetical protein
MYRTQELIGAAWPKLSGSAVGGWTRSHCLPSLQERIVKMRRVVRYYPLGIGPSEGWSAKIFLNELQAVRDHISPEHVYILGQ